METLLEQIVIYSVVLLFCAAVVYLYLRRQRLSSKLVEEKIARAKSEGLYEPVSLHPVVDPNSCIGTGACIVACPEKDILGIVKGKATTINASRCIGHGACFHACPTQAITLCLGTETRGVELPHVNQFFETNVPGIYIAGELGGMGLIKNAVEQGRQAVENIIKSGKKKDGKGYDLVIIGAGPAGISASLTAKKHHLKSITLEQDTLGGAVFHFPRSKIVMTSAMELPLVGKIKLSETNKSELLDMWMGVIQKHEIEIRENTRVDSILNDSGWFKVETTGGEEYECAHVLLAIGRRGSPRKLGVPGEELEKVAYRLLEPEDIQDKKILIVGGGDSAVESALLLSGLNNVSLSYRNENFSRLKPKNQEKIKLAGESGNVALYFNTQVERIDKSSVTLTHTGSDQKTILDNDLVYIFAGGELPTEFLKKAGISITKKFGDAILKHS